jgi:hypothetical protein
VLTTCQPSTVWCSRERLPAAAAQQAKVRQSCGATDLFYFSIPKEILKYEAKNKKSVKTYLTMEELFCNICNDLQ